MSSIVPMMDCETCSWVARCGTDETGLRFTAHLVVKVRVKLGNRWYIGAVCPDVLIEPSPYPGDLVV